MLLMLPTTAALQGIHLVQLPVLELRSQCLVRYSLQLNFSWLDCFFLYPSVVPVIVTPVDGEMFRVNRSDDIAIQCSARGIPPPSIRFLRRDVELNRTGGESGVGVGTDLASRVQLGDESSSVFMDDATFMVSQMLTIFNVAEEDAGNFTCETSSTISELGLSPSDSRTFELIVQSKFKQVYVLYSWS